MARFRRKAAKRRASSFRGSARKRRSSSSSGGSKGELMDLLVAGGYGAFRGQIANAAQMPISMVANAVPQAADYADEIVLGGSALLIGKFFPKARRYTKPILTIEAARIGAQMMTGTNTNNSSVGAIKING